jgi:hypothetical protein
MPLLFESYDSNVDIGIRDDINKGLGFETVNVDDKSHEYASLSNEHKHVLLNMRESVIEFIHKLAGLFFHYWFLVLNS